MAGPKIDQLGTDTRDNAFTIPGIAFLSAFLLLTPALANAQLNDSCTVSVLNRNIQVNPDGTWVLPNLPVNQGRVRARATCVFNGITRFGQSDLFTVPLNGSLTLQPITFGPISPIPQLLTLTPSVTSIDTIGQTSIIKTVAIYPDGTTADVSAAAKGTNYTTSDSSVATIGPDGIVQAVSNGKVLITAFNEGTSGSTLIQIGIPPTIAITSPPSGTTVTQGATIPVTAQVTGGATVASVSFSVNGRIEYTAVASPFVFNFTVPTGVTSFTLGATVHDIAGVTATSPTIVIMATPDLLTTATGSVVNQNGAGVNGATVNCLGLTGVTSLSGAFSIANVPTARGNIVCFATDVINGATFSGSSASAKPVPAGITNVGPITLTALSSRGTDFWMAFEANANGNGAQIFVLSETTANIAVSGGSGLNVKAIVTPQTPAVIAIPNSFNDFMFDKVEPNAIHLTSDAEVTATFFYPGSFFNETYLAIPTALLGTQYLAVTSSGAPQLSIIATQNNTKVTFVPTCASFLGDIAANSTVTLTMNQGDSYKYLCDNATGTPADATGSQITSDKPIGVLAGTYFTQQQSTFSFLSEMMFPIASLYGTDFYSAPVSKTGADLVRIIAARDNTHVRVDDGLSPTTYTLNRGQFKEIQSARPTHYSSDQPTSVVQFGASPQNTSFFGNLASIQIVPTGAFTTTARFYSPSGFDLGNFATIVAPTAATGSVSLNGTLVSGFLPLPGGSYSYVTVSVPTGQSVVTASQPIGVYETGFSQLGSYGNPTAF